MSAHCKRDATTNDVADYSAYPTATANAVGAWNGTPTPIFLDYGGAGPEIQVYSYNFGNTDYDGIASRGACPNGVQTEDALAYYNTYYTSDYGSTARKQLMVHELGHTLGLSHHNIPTTCPGQAIMYYSSSRWFTCSHQNPQTDDIDGINWIY